MKALIGVNGTETSLEAVKFITRLLDPARDAIVLYCSPPRINVVGSSKLAPAIPESLHAMYAESVFTHARGALHPQFQDRLQTVMSDTPPADGILDTAETQGVDLIVVGADSHPKRLMFYIGGVAHSVTQRAKVPVLVYRPVTHELPHSGIRVLLADDGSDAANRAVDTLSKFTWPAASEGWLIRVLEWLDLGTIGDHAAATDLYASWRNEYDRTVAAARSHVFEELKAKRACLLQIFAGTVPIVGEGHRIVEIKNAMQREKIDMLVRGRS